MFVVRLDDRIKGVRRVKEAINYTMKYTFCFLSFLNMITPVRVYIFQGITFHHSGPETELSIAVYICFFQSVVYKRSYTSRLRVESPRLN